MTTTHKKKKWFLGSNLSKEEADKIQEWDNFKQDVDRLSWDEYFILQAYLVSTRSLDAQTQCGCVIVRNHVIIGTGYNSFIRGIHDSLLPNLRPEKYPFMIHSEHNALLACAREGISCKDSTVYVTGIPCINCLQYMYQAGVSNIIYPKDINVAIMTQNTQEKLNNSILRKAIEYGNFPIHIAEIDLDKTVLEKIDIIKSLR